MFGFLRCLGAAILNKGPRALLAEIPLVNVLVEVADDLYKRMREEKQTEVQVQIVNVAAASPEQTNKEVAKVIEELAKDQKIEIKNALSTILKQVPASMRRSFRRADDPTGRSVPGSFAIKSGKDLIPLLPTHLPRFKPGEQPLAGVPWQLTELLGVGGFGEVWKATSLAMKNQAPRAFKFCLDPSAADSIRREAAFLDQVMKQKLAEGIVQLVDAYTQSDPICLIYEYIPGGDLTALLTRLQKYPPEKRIDTSQKIIRSLARTVGRMHQLTPPMVHRDLKPANVLVRQKDKILEFLVADFGIGAVVAEKNVAAERTGTTSQGDLLATMAQGSCTPLYASPQQKAGNPADPRDDVYALGVIWYQLLMGDATKVVSTDYIYDLRELGMTEPAIRLLGNCVAAKLERRPANAAELFKELEAIAKPQAAAPVVDPKAGTLRWPGSVLRPRTHSRASTLFGCIRFSLLAVCRGLSTDPGHDTWPD